MLLFDLNIKFFLFKFSHHFYHKQLQNFLFYQVFPAFIKSKLKKIQEFYSNKPKFFNKKYHNFCIYKL